MNSTTRNNEELSNFNWTRFGTALVTAGWSNLDKSAERERKAVYLAKLEAESKKKIADEEKKRAKEALERAKKEADKMKRLETELEGKMRGSDSKPNIRLYFSVGGILLAGLIITAIIIKR